MTDVTNADVMALDCPACGTRAGTPCFEVPGMDSFHHSRWWAAEDAASAYNVGDPHTASSASRLAEDEVDDVFLPEVGEAS